MDQTRLFLSLRFHQLRTHLTALSLGLSLISIGVCQIDLGGVGTAEVPGLRIEGIDAEDYSGIYVSGGGDVNGDGFEDFLITAHGADPGGRSAAGEVYLIWGTPEGFGADGVMRLSDLNAANGVLFEGIHAGDTLGYECVNGAGDFNGDGYADLIIGAMWADPLGISKAGEAYLIFGSPDGLGEDGVFDLTSLDGTNGVRLFGHEADSRAGLDGASAGDVNGDGFDDLVISAYATDPLGRENAGEVFLIYGAATAPGVSGELSLLALDGQNGVALQGIEAMGYLGWNTSGAGDVDGDGYDDIVIGCRGSDLIGYDFLIYGSPDEIGSGGTLDLRLIDGVNGVRFDNVSDRGSPDIVKGLGDVNGDGLSDFAIGAFGRADGVYLIFGSASGYGASGEFDLGTLDGELGLWIGDDDSNTRMGNGVAGLGDPNGDGFADMIIAGFNADPLGRVDAGEAYVFNGGRETLGEDGLFSLAEFNSALGRWFVGRAPGDNVGLGVSGAGDVNGDGYSDFIIGARGADPNGQSSAGESYLILGQGDSLCASYCTFVRPGDAPRRGVGMVGDGSHSIPLSRCWIDFAAGQGPEGGASFQTVKLMRRGEMHVQCVCRAAVMWHVETDRTDWESARLTVKYLDSEIEGLDESELVLLWAPKPDGPWNLTWNQMFLPERNEISGDLLDCCGNSVYLAISVGCPNRPDPIDLGEVGVGSIPGVRIEGVDSGDRTGINISGVGDVNGDGMEDFVVSAYMADTPQGIDTGEVYLVLGSAEGIGTNGLLDPADLTSATGAVYQGKDVQAVFGYDVAGAGDVNGDGFSDLLIGAHYTTVFGEERAGEAYLIFGAPEMVGGSGISPIANLDPSQGVRFLGIDANDNAGWRVGGVGDINGDGFGDFAISARTASFDGTSRVGEVYLIYGSDEGPGVNGVCDLTDVRDLGGVVIRGTAAEGFLGTGVSGAGDVNGDGLDDLIIAEPFPYDPAPAELSAAYLVWGSEVRLGVEGTLLLSNLDDSVGLRLHGTTLGGGISAVAGAGDFDGDGRSDLLLGAGQSPFEPQPAGEAFLVYGSTADQASGGLIDLATLNGENGLHIVSPQAESQLGNMLSSAGDMNGDGLFDVLIGAPGDYHPTPSDQPGLAYLLRGNENLSNFGSTVTMDQLRATIFEGENPGDAAGRAVACAGDVNSDGISDYLISSHLGDPGERIDAGIAYLVFGHGRTLSAAYRAYAHPDDAPRRGVGMVGDGSHSIPLSRCWIDFADGQGPSETGASLQTVEIFRASSPSHNTRCVRPRIPIARVMWRVTTDRIDGGPTEVTFKYLDSEIAGLCEQDLRLFHSETPFGPWAPAYDMTLRPERNEISGMINLCCSGTRFFAIAAPGGPLCIDPETVVRALTGETDDVTGLDLNGDGVVDAADLVLALQTPAVE